MSNWIRELTCIASGVKVKDLKIEFTINKTMDKTNNTASVKIYNLKESNRNKIKDELGDLFIYGGYRDGVQGILYKGSIKKVINYYDGPNIVTSIEASEAMLAHNYGFVNTTLEPDQTKPIDIIRVLQKAMVGVEMGETVGVRGLNNKKKRPLTVCGGTSAEMNKVCRDNRLHWSVQNGFLEVVAYNKVIEDVTVVSQASGMQSSPEPTELGVNVKTLLDYRIVPFRVIDIKSKLSKASGRFRVEEVVYSGSNIDGEYTASIKGARMVGSTVVKAKKHRTDSV